MLDKLGINPIYLLAQIVNFAILFIILSKLLYKPLLKMLDTRAKKIQEGIKAAEDNIKARETFEEQKKREMAKMRQEMEEILAKSQAEAKKAGEEIISAAREEASREADKEYQKIQQKLKQEENQIKGRLGEMAVQLTRNLLEKTLDKPLQEKIISAQVRKLGKVKK